MADNVEALKVKNDFMGARGPRATTPIKPINTEQTQQKVNSCGAPSTLFTFFHILWRSGIKLLIGMCSSSRY